MEGVAMKIATLLVAFVFYSLTFGEDQMLKINDTAPEFSLTDQNGLTYNLGDFKDKKFVVLIFYPGDQTLFVLSSSVRLGMIIVSLRVTMQLYLV
jgi:hypothetical protein